MTVKHLTAEAAAFARAFWRAMGDRDNVLKAHREAAVFIAAIYIFAGLVTLGQWMDR